MKESKKQQYEHVIGNVSVEFVKVDGKKPRWLIYLNNVDSFSGFNVTKTQILIKNLSRALIKMNELNLIEKRKKIIKND